MASPETHVFYDPEGRRWRRTRLTWIAVAVLVTAVVGVFVTSVLVNPLLPALNLRPITALPGAGDAAAPRPTPPITTRRGLALHKAQQELQQALKKTKVVPSRRPSQHPVTPPPPQAVVPVKAPASAGPQAKPLAIGFYVNWDDASYASLKRNLSQLDWVVPEWIRLQDGDDPLVRDIHRPALDLIRRERPDLPILPLVQNYQNEQWNPGLLARAVATEESRRRLVGALLQLVDENKFGGVCIDLEEVPTEAQANLRRFMQELHDAFHPRGFVITQAVPFDDTDWDYPAYAALTDYLILMGYDEHWESSAPGSIAGQQWFQRTLARRMSELDPSKTIVAIGNYGYDWSDQEKEASEVTFQEAVLSARDSEAEIKFDRATRNPYFSYEEEDGSRHTIWFLDAVSAYNQMRAADAYHPAGFALWRLGSEDPSLWSIFGGGATDSTEGLKTIRYGYDVDFDGMGEVLQVIAEPRDGSREFTPDAGTGQIGDERYTATPSSYVVRRAGYHPGLVALTFDDGPDPVWTPPILDILKREQVPATFFIIGQNGQERPDLVRRIVAEGHDIGNHTFTHPNLGEIPGALVDLELNATQRLIESQTGRSTALFRPPYFGDAEPQTPDEVGPIVRARRLGYVTVGLRVDPDDWDQPRSTADLIVRKTVEGVTSTDPDVTGQVVLLHDGGGDRSQTVEALPRLIGELRAHGYRFVTTTELAGLTRDQSMPPLPESRGLYEKADAVTFFTLSTLGWLLQWVFVAGIVLGLARILVIGSLSFAQWVRARRRAASHFGEEFAPFVSVVVPAYNEERVIAQTVRSLLASRYENFEIIVVDDGSPDRTSEVVREEFAGEPRVRLFTRENAGKAEALNYGLARARGEVVIGLDADTLFEPDTLAALARRFRDERMGAVAGNAKVGNRLNVVTRWQALEYVTSQNTDRRAFASLNCITVVPGAVGAWRRELLERAGGFSSDTLAEDQDLTLRVRRLGYKIGYSERAVAWTEAPDTLRALAKQRFRWAYGTLQCMWKHRGALLRPRYGTLGLFAMPNVWVFQILFPLVSPVMDLMLLWSLFEALLQRWQHGEEYAGSNLKQVLFYYALFLAVDWLSAAFAFALERREQWSLLWWLFLQRFCYRQVMYYVMIKSVVVAFRGVTVGWGKLERKATVGARS